MALFLPYRRALELYLMKIAIAQRMQLINITQKLQIILHHAILLLDANSQVHYHAIRLDNATQHKPQTTGLGRYCMNTLTQFINAQLSLSQKLTAQEGQVISEDSNCGLYEIIENEEIKSCNFKGLTVSGSLFSLTTFKNVTFESCVFYANRFENCTFLECNFINCTFEFSQISHCNFNRCTMEEAIFNASPITKSTVSFCTYDYKFEYFLNKKENKVFGCHDLAPVTWEDVLEAEADRGLTNSEIYDLPPVPQLDSHEEDNIISLESIVSNEVKTAVQNILKKFKAA